MNRQPPGFYVLFFGASLVSMVAALDFGGKLNLAIYALTLAVLCNAVKE